MKNLLLLLILANVLYLMWGMFTTQGPQPGVVVVEQSDLGPPLDVTTGQDSDSIASVGAVLGAGEPSDLEAVVGRSCVTIGPFWDRARADTAALEYNNEGMRTAVRAGKAEKFIGHSVQVADVENREAGREMVRQLEQQGLENPFIVGNDEVGYAIALGIFTEAANAEKVELQARSAGFDVEITPMIRDRDAFWVDVALPPGRGAGAIVEQYGEDQVALREAATCP
jgi:hypothetical protein